MNNEKIKRCGLCDEVKLVSEFPTCKNGFLFHKDGFYSICYDCLANKINAEDLDTVNKLCQTLDIAFYPDTWIKLYNTYYRDYGTRGILENYINASKKNEFKVSDWKEQTLLWDKARECNNVLEEMTTLRGEMFIYLQKKWGKYDDFSVEDYMKMESYERHTLNYYNFRDEARRDLVRKMALLSVLIDKKLASGDTREMTSMISAYQSLMKESGIQNLVSNDTESITSVSEIVAYLERNGWLMDYRVTEERDIVDSTINNIQAYLHRLVSDSSEEIRTSFETEKLNQESGTEFNEESLEMLFDSQNDEEDLIEGEMLSEEELTKMFNGLDKEYGEK